MEWIILAGAGAVLAYDTLGSFASKRMGFAYRRLAKGSYVIYAVVGFCAALVGAFWSGVQSAAVVGLVDATAGWFISWQIGPGRLPEGTVLNEGKFLVIVVLVTLMATGAGGIGAGVATVYRAWGG